MNKLSLTSRLPLMLLSVLLTACGREDALQDLRVFVDEGLSRPAGPIEPLPAFISYDPFTYSAAGQRSPFVSPQEVAGDRRDLGASEVRPNLERSSEALESFALSSLRMVGTIERRGERWALIEDSNNVIHRVARGNYLGRNHGRIVAISPQGLELIEIVPSGEHERWIERPQSLRLGDSGGLDE